jgi:hypothetical protein
MWFLYKYSVYRGEFDVVIAVLFAKPIGEPTQAHFVNLKVALNASDASRLHHLAVAAFGPGVVLGWMARRASLRSDVVLGVAGNAPKESKGSA